MRHWVIIPIAASLTLSSLVSCTTHVDISFDEMTSQAAREIDRIVYLTTISGLILESGNEVRFDDTGGRYHSRQRLITGATPSGDSLSTNTADIEEVLLSHGSPEGGAVDTVDVWKFMRLAETRRWRDHYGRSVRPDGSVELLRDQAEKVPDEGLFRSVSVGGIPIVVRPDEVYFQTRRFSLGKTFFLVAGVAAVTAGIAAIIYIATVAEWGNSGGW